jgi:hypothetical protein
MQSKEREILMVMRKVLAAVIKDTTPPAGMRHPLSDRTIEDVRQCLGLIAAREKELADAAGVTQERPYYADEQQASKVVPLSGIGRRPKDDAPED